MATIAWICVTVMVTSAIVSEALPFVPDTEKQSLISMLLQSPPIAEAACLVRDVNSVGVIVNKVCDCGGSTVACDIGPVKVGDFEVTFCNKKPNQPVEDLLIMKFACDVANPNCGEGTPCDTGPIEYNNKKYFLCLYETDFLPPPNDFDICHPATNRSEPGSKSERPTTASETAITNPAVTRPTTIRPPWRPWNPPCYPWQSKSRSANRRQSRPHWPPSSRRSPPMGWGIDPWLHMDHIFGGLLGLGGGSRWQEGQNPAGNPAGKPGTIPRFDGTSGLGGGSQWQEGQNPAGNPAGKPGTIPRFDGTSGLGGGSQWQDGQSQADKGGNGSQRQKEGGQPVDGSGALSGFGGGFQWQKGSGQSVGREGQSGWLTGFGDPSQWRDGASQPREGQPGVHVYERRRWRVGNTGGEITWGKRPQDWHRDRDSSSSSSEER